MMNAVHGFSRSVLLVALVCASSAEVLAEGPADAAGAVSIELNKLESNGPDCQATVVTKNGPERLESLKLDLVIFDGQGVVAKRIAAELGPMPKAKTLIKTFAVKDLGCASITRVVLNDILACSGPAGPLADCLDRLTLATRTTAEFTQ